MKELLRIVGRDSVESSLCWKVDILSPGALAYREGERSIHLEMEDRPDAQGELEWTIYMPEEWRWDACKDELPTQEKISEILNRIELAFWKLDMRVKEIV